MSIEKQYYTPTLSEFYPNFRYEYLLGSHLDKNIPNNEKEWGQYNFAKDSPPIFDIEGWRMNLEDCIKDGFIRVKSLDHDDIIEAGWELIEDGKHIVEFMIKGSNEDTNIYLTYRTESEFIEIHNNGDNIEDHIYYFQGTVKNYNKLLDVMEMLGITANS